MGGWQPGGQEIVGRGPVQYSRVPKGEKWTTLLLTSIDHRLGRGAPTEWQLCSLQPSSLKPNDHDWVLAVILA